MTISVEIINQLSDNYSYLISNNESSSGIIIDPAEPDPIMDILKGLYWIIIGLKIEVVRVRLECQQEKKIL